MTVPDTRLDKLEQAVKKMLEEDTESSVRELASVAGKVISMAPAVPAARLLTHETYKLVRPEDGDWDTTAVITEAVKAELREVLEWTRKWNRRGAPIRCRLGATELRIISDAGPTGYGYRVDGRSVQLQMGDHCKAEAKDWATPAEAEAW